MICPCGGAVLVVTKQLLLEPDWTAPLHVPAADLHECTNCNLAKPTEATRRRIFQMLELDPDQPLPGACKVSVASWVPPDDRGRDVQAP